jgi:hypothetical protein
VVFASSSTITSVAVSDHLTLVRALFDHQNPLERRPARFSTRGTDWFMRSISRERKSAEIRVGLQSHTSEKQESQSVCNWFIRWLAR